MAVDVPPSWGPSAFTTSLIRRRTRTGPGGRGHLTKEGLLDASVLAVRGHLEVEKREDGTWRLRSPEWSRSAPRTEGIRTSGPSRASEPGGLGRGPWEAVRTEPTPPGPVLARRRRRGDREARRPVSADGPQTARHPAAIPVAVGLAPEPLPLLNRQRPRQAVFASVPWWDSRGGQIEAGPGPRGKEQDRGRPLGRTQPPVSAVGLGSVEVLDEQQIDHPGTDKPERPPGGRELSAFNSLTRQVPPALGDPRLVGHHARGPCHLAPPLGRRAAPAGGDQEREDECGAKHGDILGRKGTGFRSLPQDRCKKVT